MISRINEEVLRVKIKWLGHASFLITSDTGTRIITDPYIPTEELCYGEIKEAADIITVSHDHSDHNNVATIRGNPKVIRSTAVLKGISFKGIPTYHDESSGEKRGKNTIFCFAVDGVTVCHLGDLGHALSDNQVTKLGKIDMLLVPVGGFYTIDTTTASLVCDQLKPKVIIPMHFKNDKCHFPITGVDEFLKGKKGVTRLNTSEVEFKSEELPLNVQIIVLKPAL